MINNQKLNIMEYAFMQDQILQTLNKRIVMNDF